MKPSPQYDFPVSVRRQTWEEELDVANYYEGIFDVSLNYSFSVMFVPATERNAWPPTLPENADAVASEQEARLICLALARYAVTPYEALAGQEELLVREWPESGPGLLFYVSEAEFTKFSRELSTLADERPAVHSGWKVSEIPDLAVTNFFLSRMLVSKNVSRKDLEMLER